MTPTQIETIKAEIAEIKAMLDADDENRKSDVGNFRHSRAHLNVEEVKESIYARTKQLEIYTPTKLTGQSANKAYAYAKQLKTWIETNMPKETFVTYPREKDPASKTVDFERAVQAQVRWQEHGQKAIHVYQYLMRRLDPDKLPDNFNRLVRERP